MMILADEDGDGNINYEEFISMLFKVGEVGYSFVLNTILVLKTPWASGNRKGCGYQSGETISLKHC